MQRCRNLQRRDSARRGAAALLLALAGCGSSEAMNESDVVRIIGADEAAAADHVLDARESDSFQEGHIEGACSVDPSRLRSVIDGIEGQVPLREVVWEVLGEAGLEADDTVVITDVDNGTDPARIAWTLRHYGHRGDVILLDGGMDAYAAAGLPVVTTDAAEPTAYQGGATREELRVDKDWMLDHLDDGNVAIFDVRAPDEYTSGHIPGAINVDWEETKNADGSFKTSEEIRALHGDPGARTLVVYCRTGSRAAVSWAMLTRAGYSDVRLYDGSWAEWGNDDDTPKERG